LLFPEAFGLMTLVSVITIGVLMLSDVGIGLSISQSKRGDDPTFLDTAWTIQVIRGGGLAVILAAVAQPAAHLYQEPLLAAFLPVSAVGLFISGFNPMRIETAARHMLLGRLTAIELLTQAVSTLATIGLAWITQSVWALIWGTLLGAALRVVLAHLMMPGTRSRFFWDAAAARELIHFGKWIFASTAFGFMLAQGDRVILGTYISLDLLGIYNVAQFLATAPILLATNAVQKIIIPLYRESMSDTSDVIKRRLTVLRRFFTGGALILETCIALIAVTLVGIMYDDRYTAAGPIAVLLALAQMPLIIGLTYDRAALAAGNSKNFFYSLAFRTILQVGLIVAGAQLGGLVGALAGQFLAGSIGHASLIWLARESNVWDPWHDLGYSLLALVLGGVTLWMNWSSVLDLIAA
jgi:O-antigen/teichoic acid export membrane protein